MLRVHISRGDGGDGEAGRDEHRRADVGRRARTGNTRDVRSRNCRIAGRADACADQVTSRFEREIAVRVIDELISPCEAGQVSGARCKLGIVTRAILKRRDRVGVVDVVEDRAVLDRVQTANAGRTGGRNTAKYAVVCVHRIAGALFAGTVSTYPCTVEGAVFQIQGLACPELAESCRVSHSRDSDNPLYKRPESRNIAIRSRPCSAVFEADVLYREVGRPGSSVL